MGTLTEVLRLLLWVLVIIPPPFESASVFRRMIHDGGAKHEQRIHRVQDIYLNKVDNRRPFAVFPFWNKAHGSSAAGDNPATSTPSTVAGFNVDIEFPPPRRTLRVPQSSRNASSVIKRSRRRRKPVGPRVRASATTLIPPVEEVVTPTVLTQLRTVSEMLVTRNVTSTRTVTESPFTDFVLEDGEEGFSSHPFLMTTTLFPEEEPTTPPPPPATTTTATTTMSEQEKRVGREERPPVTTTAPPELHLFPTTDFPELTSTPFSPEEELRSPKRIRHSPAQIELLNPFEEKAAEEAPGPEEGPHGGQYHEVNPGQYHEVNPGQYHEENPGQYHEINPGQYVHHSETEEGNPTTIQIHHRDEDKKVYNVQSKVDEFIIGEYGTISKSSGQTLQGVRYTAIGESVDSKLIYDTLIKFFNFE